MNPFRVGPILTEPAALRMPLPVNFMGSWAWVEKTGVSFAPADSRITPATPESRYPLAAGAAAAA